MAKITIDPMSGSYASVTAMNTRFQQIEDALNDNVLWRDGFVAEPNVMNVELDMNNKQILNLPAPINNNSAARLQDVLDATSGAATAATTTIVDVLNYYTSDNVEGALQEVGTTRGVTLGLIEGVKIQRQTGFVLNGASSYEWTGIPADAERITVSLWEVSLSGTELITVQAGADATYTDTYLSAGAEVTGVNTCDVGGAGGSAYFPHINSTNADLWTGKVTFELALVLGSIHKYVITSILGSNNTTDAAFVTGSLITTNGPISHLRIKSQATDTFDNNGSYATISWEL